MRYAQLRSMDISNGNYVGCALFTQGCSVHCHNCFSQQTWDFNGGKLWTKAEDKNLYGIVSKPYIKRFSILGGEPLDQAKDLIKIITEVRNVRPDIKIWLYSGRTYEENIKDPQRQSCIDICDILVDGPFIDKLKDMNLLYRGSSNQRIVDIQATIKTGHIVTLD